MTAYRVKILSNVTASFKSAGLCGTYLLQWVAKNKNSKQTRSNEKDLKVSLFHAAKGRSHTHLQLSAAFQSVSECGQFWDKNSSQST